MVPCSSATPPLMVLLPRSVTFTEWNFPMLKLVSQLFKLHVCVHTCVWVCTCVSLCAHFYRSQCLLFSSLAPYLTFEISSFTEPRTHWLGTLTDQKAPRTSHVHRPSRGCWWAKFRSSCLPGGFLYCQSQALVVKSSFYSVWLGTSVKQMKGWSIVRVTVIWLWVTRSLCLSNDQQPRILRW